MKDFKQIDACDVIEHLKAGKKVCACVLRSRNFNERLYDLSEWTMGQLVRLVKEENVVFFEKTED